MMKTTLRWACVSLVFWTAVAVFFALPPLGENSNAHRVLFSALAQWWSWGILAPAILAMDGALPYPAQRLLARFLTLFAVGPFVTILYGYIEAILRALLGVGAWSRLSGTNVVTEAVREMFWSMLVYCLILGV